jgi:hypothetical protein
MKRTLMSFAFAALALAAVAIPAHAATADFDGYCTPISYTCDFDSAYTSSGGSGTSCSPFTISSYSWTFTNNTATASGSTATHTFASNAGGNATLQITCSNGSTASKTRPVCFSFGVPGCIVPVNSTWN